MRRPIARPARAEANRRDLAAGQASREISPPKDLVSSRSKYVTAERVRLVRQETTERDRAVLNFVSESRLASGKQLIRQFWQTADRDTAEARAGRRALKRLADNRVLDPLPRRIGSRRSGSDGLVYGVGRLGARLLAERGYRGPRIEAPGALYVDHTLAATELVVALTEANRAGVLELIERQFEPACWRGFIGTGGLAVRLKPDLFVRIGVGTISEDRWMIEMDRATEASSTLRAKAQRHLDYWGSGGEPVAPRVLWAVPDVRRAEQVAAVLRPLKAPERLFAICLGGEVVDFLATEASS